MRCQIRHEKIREKNREAMTLFRGSAWRGHDIAVAFRRWTRGHVDLEIDPGSRFREAMLRSRSRVDLSIAIDDDSSLPRECHFSSFIQRAPACPARKTFEPRERDRQRVASYSVHVLVQCTRANTLELPCRKRCLVAHRGYTHEGRTRPVAVAPRSSEAIAVAALSSRRAFGPWEGSSL
jgi:hypothetical protein